MMNVGDQGHCNMPVNYGASISSSILERGILHVTYQNPALNHTGKSVTKTK
jgi:hypothetical protein